MATECTDFICSNLALELQKLLKTKHGGQAGCNVRILFCSEL